MGLTLADIQRNTAATIEPFPNIVSPVSTTTSSSVASSTVAGIVDSTGTLVSGSGFTSSKTSTGHYTVTFSPAFSAEPKICVQVNAQHGGAAGVISWKVLSSSASSFTLNTYNTTVDVDCGFDFIAMA